MNKTTIPWGIENLYTWNPGYGCLRGCEYCYARDLHNKRMKAKKAGKKLSAQYDKPFNEIQYFMERLKIVKKSRVVKKVFVGSMSDICYWDTVFMALVLRVIRMRLEITFMFLTKDPSVYYRYDFPPNCILGVTATSNDDLWKVDLLSKFLSVFSTERTFVSIEPILGNCAALDLVGIDLVIVGADSRKGSAAPKKEWLDSIQHHNIYLKPNVRHFYKS